MSSEPHKHSSDRDAQAANGDLLQQVQHYRDVVLQYEAVDDEIDSLLMAHGGKSDQLPPSEMARYRKLAQKRDDLFNEMRLLERVLLDDHD